MASIRSTSLSALLVLSAAAVLLTPGAAPTAEDQGKPVPLTGELLQEGLKLLKQSAIDTLNGDVCLGCSFSTPGGFTVTPFELTFKKDRKEISERLKREQDEIEGRLKNAPNEILRQQLQVMQDQVAADLARNELLDKQAQAAGRLVEYTQQRDEGVMRKLRSACADSGSQLRQCCQ